MTKRQIPAEVRQLCYVRDNYSCQVPSCDASRNNGARLNLHHVFPEQFGGQETPDNLITLCDIHHKGQHIEFSAYYPDSSGVLKRMNTSIRRRLSQIKKAVGLDDGRQLLPYLKFLAGPNAKFRRGQVEAIRAAMAGRDVLLVSPTGSGKSVCYQMPGMLGQQPSLVVCPLKALMKDQVESIWAKRIPATYINSDLGGGEKSQRYNFITRQLYKFIFVAPERFTSNDPEHHHLYRQYSYMVVDEAHVVDKWGLSFRPAYRQLGHLRQKLGNPPVIALTATASRQSQQAILSSLGIPKAKVVVAGFYRDNIKIYNRNLRSDEEKHRYIEGLIRKNPNDKILVFALTVRKGEELVQALSQKGIEVGLFHSKLDTNAKMELQNRFSGLAEPKIRVLISTSAFGMGIDIPDIRHVVHILPPTNLTDYVQQIGRAGRDGQPSKAHLLYRPYDKGLMNYMALDTIYWKKLAEDNNYNPEEIRQIKQKLKNDVDTMRNFTKLPAGREWDYILNYFGENRPSGWQTHGAKILYVTLLLIILPLALYLLALMIMFWWLTFGLSIVGLIAWLVLRKLTTN